MFLSKYGVARVIYIPLVKRGVVDFAVSADWTPAAGDVKISKDGGAASNVTNLPTAITMGNTAMWSFSITATEMQAAQISITVADAATKAVEDQMFIIESYGDAAAQHAFDLDAPINDIRDSVFSRAFSAAYGSHTFDELIKMISSVLLAKVSGMGASNPIFRNLADNADVINATTDSNGNRTAVTRTP